MNNILNLNIGVIGAHGRTGRLLLKTLKNYKFNNITAFTRNLDNGKDNNDPTIKQIFLDLENGKVDELVKKFQGVDILVFVASTGTQGISQLFTVDIDGVSKCVEAAERCKNIKRFILTSVINVEQRDFWWSMDGNLRNYFIAKRCADHEVRYSKLNWTILQPGWLSINNKPTGKISRISCIEDQRINGYTIEREDLAEVIAQCILNPENTSMKSIPLANGDTEIETVIKNI